MILFLLLLSNLQNLRTVLAYFYVVYFNILGISILYISFMYLSTSVGCMIFVFTVYPQIGQKFTCKDEQPSKAIVSFIVFITFARNNFCIFRQYAITFMTHLILPLYIFLINFIFFICLFLFSC